MYLWERIAKKRDPFTFLIGNIVTIPPMWINDFSDQNGWRTAGYLEAKEQKFAEDIKLFDPDFQSNFEGPDNKLWFLWHSGQINIETIALLDRIGKFTPIWEKSFDPYWSKQDKKDLLLINKYAIFFEGVDCNKYKALLAEQFKL